MHRGPLLEMQSRGRKIGRRARRRLWAKLFRKASISRPKEQRRKKKMWSWLNNWTKFLNLWFSSQAFSSLTQPNKLNALKALVNPNFSKELKKEASSVSKIHKQDEPDHYDKLVNEMMMESRARPSDRTKTPEEIAVVQKERLEELELQPLLYAFFY